MTLTYKRKCFPSTWRETWPLDVEIIYESAKWAIIHDKDNDTIIIYDDRWNRAILADKNLWATECWKSGATTSNNSGNWYQWWNNYWFTWNSTSWSKSSSTIDATGYWPGNYYSSSTFRNCWEKNWSNPDNTNLWWYDVWTEAARQWPCTSWRHVPSIFEWDFVVYIWKYVTWYDEYDMDEFRGHFYIPTTWQRSWNNIISMTTSHALLTTSDVFNWWPKIQRLFIKTPNDWIDTIWHGTANNTSIGFALRPFITSYASKAFIMSLNMNDAVIFMNLKPADYYTLYPDLDWWDDWEGNVVNYNSETSKRYKTYTPPPVVWHKDTQWPCPNGFHIWVTDEWNLLKTALTTLWLWDKTNFMTYLKVPSAYYLNRSNGSENTSYWPVRFWTSTMTSTGAADCMYVDEKDKIGIQSDKAGNAFCIRPFKDNAEIPDGTWTLLTTWVYWSEVKWLISITADGWLSYITIADRNLWATNVWDNGLYYQFWNNYWFSPSPSNYRTSKVTTDMTQYYPGNYYNDSTYTRVSSGNNWFTVTNNNIWWWVTNGTWTDPV